MSPEQAAGAPLDGRSDLYSLGVTAWFALTGRLPFEGDNVAALIVRQAAAPAPTGGTGPSRRSPRPVRGH